MSRYIIHKDGAYNFYTTVADGACYEEALTLDELTEIVKETSGTDGLQELPARLERAHRTGCSGAGWTLDDCIRSTREPHMNKTDFIAKYLTLRKE